MTTETATTDLKLPRALWPTHPNYPDHLLLVRSHEGFRATSAHLVRQAEAGADPRAIGARFRWLKSAMHGHEGYEEHKLYPYLEARWGISCAALRAGHEALDEAERAVYAAVDAPGESGLRLGAALRRHDEVLDAHLREEEDVVIPALLALTPDEFRIYYHSTIGALLAQLRREG